MRAPTVSRPHLPGHDLLPAAPGTTDDVQQPVVLDGVAEAVTDHRLLPGFSRSPTRRTFPN